MPKDQEMKQAIENFITTFFHPTIYKYTTGIQIQAKAPTDSKKEEEEYEEISSSKIQLDMETEEHTHIKNASSALDIHQQLQNQYKNILHLTLRDIIDSEEEHTSWKELANFFKDRIAESLEDLKKETTISPLVLANIIYFQRKMLASHSTYKSMIIGKVTHTPQNLTSLRSLLDRLYKFEKNPISTQKQTKSSSLSLNFASISSSVSKLSSSKFKTFTTIDENEINKFKLSYNNYNLSLDVIKQLPFEIQYDILQANLLEHDKELDLKITFEILANIKDQLKESDITRLLQFSSFEKFQTIYDSFEKIFGDRLHQNISESSWKCIFENDPKKLSFVLSTDKTLHPQSISSLIAEKLSTESIAKLFEHYSKNFKNQFDQICLTFFNIKSPFILTTNLFQKSGSDLAKVLNASIVKNNEGEDIFHEEAAAWLNYQISQFRSSGFSAFPSHTIGGLLSNLNDLLILPCYLDIRLALKIHFEQTTNQDVKNEALYLTKYEISNNHTLPLLSEPIATDLFHILKDHLKQIPTIKKGEESGLEEKPVTLHKIYQDCSDIFLHLISEDKDFSTNISSGEAPELAKIALKRIKQTKNTKNFIQRCISNHTFEPRTVIDIITTLSTKLSQDTAFGETIKSLFSHYFLALTHEDFIQSVLYSQFSQSSTKETEEEVKNDEEDDIIDTRQTIEVPNYELIKFLLTNLSTIISSVKKGKKEDNINQFYSSIPLMGVYNIVNSTKELDPVLFDKLFLQKIIFINKNNQTDEFKNLIKKYIYSLIVKFPHSQHVFEAFYKNPAFKPYLDHTHLALSLSQPIQQSSDHFKFAAFSSSSSSKVTNKIDFDPQIKFLNNFAKQIYDLITKKSINDSHTILNHINADKALFADDPYNFLYNNLNQAQPTQLTIAIVNLILSFHGFNRKKYIPHEGNKKLSILEKLIIDSRKDKNISFPMTNIFHLITMEMEQNNPYKNNLRQTILEYITSDEILFFLSSDYPAESKMALLNIQTVKERLSIDDLHTFINSKDNHLPTNLINELLTIENIKLLTQKPLSKRAIAAIVFSALEKGKTLKGFILNTNEPLFTQENIEAIFAVPADPKSNSILSTQNFLKLAKQFPLQSNQTLVDILAHNQTLSLDILEKIIPIQTEQSIFDLFSMLVSTQLQGANDTISLFDALVRSSAPSNYELQKWLLNQLLLLLKLQRINDESLLPQIYEKVKTNVQEDELTQKRVYKAILFCLSKAKPNIVISVPNYDPSFVSKMIELLQSSMGVSDQGNQLEQWVQSEFFDKTFLPSTFAKTFETYQEALKDNKRSLRASGWLFDKNDKENPYRGISPDSQATSELSSSKLMDLLPQTIKKINPTYVQVIEKPRSLEEEMETTNSEPQEGRNTTYTRSATKEKRRFTLTESLNSLFSSPFGEWLKKGTKDEQPTESNLTFVDLASDGTSHKGENGEKETFQIQLSSDSEEDATSESSSSDEEELKKKGNSSPSQQAPEDEEEEEKEEEEAKTNNSKPAPSQQAPEDEEEEEKEEEEAKTNDSKPAPSQQAPENEEEEEKEEEEAKTNDSKSAPSQQAPEDEKEEEKEEEEAKTNDSKSAPSQQAPEDEKEEEKEEEEAKELGTPPPPPPPPQGGSSTTPIDMSKVNLPPPPQNANEKEKTKKEKGKGKESSSKFPNLSRFFPKKSHKQEESTTSGDTQTTANKPFSPNPMKKID